MSAPFALVSFLGQMAPPFDQRHQAALGDTPVRMCPSLVDPPLSTNTSANGQMG
jgi:hypothetical protein